MGVALFVVGWLAAGLITARAIYWALDRWDRHDGPDDMPYWALALIWPVAVVVAVAAGMAFGIQWLVTRPPTGRQRRVARQAARDAELVALRKLAREHGLPWVESGDP